MLVESPQPGAVVMSHQTRYIYTYTIHAVQAPQKKLVSSSRVPINLLTTSCLPDRK